MNKTNITKLHSIFWALAVFIQTTTITNEIGNTEPVIIITHNLLEIFFGLFFFYSFYLSHDLIFPGELYRKKQVIFFIIISLLFIGVFNFLFTYAYIAVRYPAETMPAPGSAPFRYLYFDLITTHFVYSVIGTLFRFTIQWYRKSKKQEELEKQNITDEFMLLQTKISPDFLFNTLNNINSLIRKEPEKASYIVIKLSGILWYMLYDASSEKVQLEQEIELIKNYIELQSDAGANHELVEFNIIGQSFGVLVPPLLFMPFIENAFRCEKNKNENKNGYPGIIINLKTYNNFIYFDITNCVSQKSKNYPEMEESRIKNIRRRLDIILENKYKLDISNNNESFSVKLEINYK